MKALPVVLALMIIIVALTSCVTPHFNYVPKPDDSWLYKTL